jgi:hypothetical protein
MFHVHTVYSGDGRITLPELSRRARGAGLQCLFITDHNTIEGARRFQERFPEFHTVVGEEIMTQSGEVMGLFLKEEIKAGASFGETVAKIREQGGLVALPHPYDAWRPSSLKADVLDAAFGQTDIVEVFNCRTFSARHDRRAAEVCKQHGKLALHGADAHFPEEIGRATFDLPEPPTRENFPWPVSRVHARRDSYAYRGCLRLKSLWGKYSPLNLPEQCFTALQRWIFLQAGGSFFTLRDVDALARQLAEQVMASDYRPDFVVGIANGGLYPAFKVAQALRLPFETLRISHRQFRIGHLDTDDILGGCYVRDALYGNDTVVHGTCPEAVRGKRILLVDDESGRGRTFRAALRFVAGQACDAKTACLRVLKGDYDPDYFITDHRGKRFKFPRFPWFKYAPEYLQYAKIKEKWLYPSKFDGPA